MGGITSKKLFVLIVCSISLITACTKTENSLKEKVSQLEEQKTNLTLSLNEKENQIEKINQNITELEKQMETNKKEKDLFPLISNLSMEFVRAHTTGDKEKLQELLSKDIILQERDNKLYSINNAYDEWVLFSYEVNTHLDNWVIQGFHFNSESNTYNVHIREYIKDLNGNPVSPPTFLYLTFKMFNNEWKVIGLGFDV